MPQCYYSSSTYHCAALSFTTLIHSYPPSQARDQLSDLRFVVEQQRKLVAAQVRGRGHYSLKLVCVCVDRGGAGEVYLNFGL